MARDNFYAVDVSQEKWDSIFGKKEEKKERVCQCGHTKNDHNCMMVDGPTYCGSDTRCNRCACQEYREKCDHEYKYFKEKKANLCVLCGHILFDNVEEEHD